MYLDLAYKLQLSLSLSHTHTHTEEPGREPLSHKDSTHLISDHKSVYGTRVVTLGGAGSPVSTDGRGSAIGGNRHGCLSITIMLFKAWSIVQPVLNHLLNKVNSSSGQLYNVNNQIKPSQTSVNNRISITAINVNIDNLFTVASNK